MNTQEYISSGILEQYVLGTLSEEEMREVDRMARTHPEIREELDEIMQSMAGYAEAHGKGPEEGLLSDILSEINEEEDNVKPISDAPSKPQDGSGFTGRLAAAAVILLLLSLGMNIYLFFQWQDLNEEIVALETEKTVLAEKVEFISNQNTAFNDYLTFISQPETRQVTMKGVESTPDALATVFWNESSGEVLVNPVSLPPAPEGKQYQLWALKDGKPIDAGLIAKSGVDLQQMKQIDAADAFAVTLEPAGGSVSPTLEKLTVMGKLSTSG